MNIERARAARERRRRPVSRLEEVAPGDWDEVLERVGVPDVYFRSGVPRERVAPRPGSPGLPPLPQLGGRRRLPGASSGTRPTASRTSGRRWATAAPSRPGRSRPPPRSSTRTTGGVRENRVVATFARFHPVLENQRLAEGRWHLEHIGHSIGWRVAGRSAEDLAAGMDAHHRRVLRKARGAAIEVTVETAPGDLAEFVSLYEETMRRRSASAFYFFPGAYWEQLTDPLRAAVVRADARLEGELVASIVCLSAPPLLHYHLGASSEQGQRLGANHLLFCETAAWAAEHGFRLFHLAAGSVGSRIRCTSSSGASTPRERSRRSSARRYTTPTRTARSREGARSTTPATFRRTVDRAERPRRGYRRAVIRKALFWGSLGALAWTHVGYPAAAAALARIRPRPVRKDDVTPVVSVIVAAHDEEDVIGRRVENLLELDYPADRLRDRRRLRRLDRPHERDRPGARRSAPRASSSSSASERARRPPRTPPSRSRTPRWSHSPTPTRAGSPMRCASSFAASPTPRSATCAVSSASSPRTA